LGVSEWELHASAQAVENPTRARVVRMFLRIGVP
jgi:hypothetical protein